jgi:hypothetical protein
MTWSTFHRRGDVLNAVVETADHRRDGALPLDVPGVAERFVDEIDLIGALLLKWHARLSGNIEQALAQEPTDLESAVSGAWRRTAEQMPGVRLLVDRATDLPGTEEMAAAMQRARHAERIRLAQAAGLANDASGRAAAAGARIERAARKGLSEQPPAPASAPASTRTSRLLPSDRDRESFVRRIKAVLAA